MTQAHARIIAFESDDILNKMFVDELDTVLLDQSIEHDVQTLQQEHCVHLPEDKGTLLKLYDRLQQRKSRRLQRLFYISATETKLKDLIINFLEDEIDDKEYPL